MTEITYQTMCTALPEWIPELHDAYQEEVRWWRGKELPPHVVYAQLLNPLLFSLLVDDESSESLRRIFSLLEVLASHEDPEVSNVVHVTVLEYIHGHGADYSWKRAIPLMGPATRKLASEVESA